MWKPCSREQSYIMCSRCLSTQVLTQPHRRHGSRSAAAKTACKEQNKKEKLLTPQQHDAETPRTTKPPVGCRRVRPAMRRRGRRAVAVWGAALLLGVCFPPLPADAVQRRSLDDGGDGACQQSGETPQLVRRVRAENEGLFAYALCREASHLARGRVCPALRNIDAAALVSPSRKQSRIPCKRGPISSSLTPLPTALRCASGTCQGTRGGSTPPRRAWRGA